jgi:hypothetical protein
MVLVLCLGRSEYMYIYIYPKAGTLRAQRAFLKAVLPLGAG